MKNFLLLVLLGTLLLNVPGVQAAAPAKPGPAGEFPLHISAARLEADQNQGFVLFIGQVKATYGDSILYSDRLWVYFKPKPPAAKGTAPGPAKEPGETSPSPLGELGGDKIDRIVAKGQVRFVQEDRVATGDEATYYKDRDEVVLLGNPQLWRAENTLKGERIIFNLSTNRVVVESSPQKRVEALLYTQGTAGSKETLPLAPKPQKSRRP